MTIRWITGFLDPPMPTFVAAVGFWRSVTGYGLSASRGEHHQFATLLPPEGDPCWRVQGVGNGAGGARLHLHVDDVPAETERAVGLGAEVMLTRTGSRC